MWFHTYKVVTFVLLTLKIESPSAIHRFPCPKRWIFVINIQRHLSSQKCYITFSEANVIIQLTQLNSTPSPGLRVLVCLQQPVNDGLVVALHPFDVCDSALQNLQDWTAELCARFVYEAFELWKRQDYNACVPKYNPVYYPVQMI